MKEGSLPKHCAVEPSSTISDVHAPAGSSKHAALQGDDMNTEDAGGSLTPCPPQGSSREGAT